MAADILTYPSSNLFNLTRFEKGSGEFPKEIVGEVWRNIQHASVVQQVAGTTPVPISGGVTYIQTGDLVAGVVGEGRSKPVTSGGLASKAFKPIKVAAIMYWSKEARQLNPGGYLDTLVENLTSAVARSIDMAVIHGVDALSGSQISGVECLTQTSNSVALGTATAANGGLNSDLLDGYDALADGGYSLTGFIADPSLRSKLMRATDANGHPIYQSAVNLNESMDSVLGLPIVYGRGVVSGNVGGSSETDVRAIGGDFASNLRLGFVENITFKRTDTATIDDGIFHVNLWQQNMEAILVEAQFGWVIRDVDAFVKYTYAPTTTSTSNKKAA